MQYYYVPNDMRHYATSLRINRSTGNLAWDCAKGQDSLVIQTEFGRSPFELMESTICPALSQIELSHERFVEVLPEVWARPVSATERARFNNGCPLHARACTYSVFATIRDTEGNVKVFAPKTQSMTPPSCNVPQELGVSVKRHTIVEGLFRKREVDTGYWCISFGGSLDGLADDADLYYCLGQESQLRIPLTVQAVSAGSVYVRSKTQPYVKTGNRGLHIVEK